MKVYVLVMMFQDVVSDILVYEGKRAEEMAREQFKIYTDVDYLFFDERLESGEAHDQILGEDYAGTMIYHLEIIQDASN
ncbi:hypothetical protein [Paenibacillus lutrae]|uniref:Uncharacterized protein n=1 Tax=Paenibacillus lutrae TaxID=2078573 RepID=A0A7X3K1G7_9BACL|nr:hypothetical protein [Paenibacillus lutrae]MVP02095.1 hypothetical protein [Paenibacillus lutrae]